VRERILENVERPYLKKRPGFHVGDTVTVHVRLKEGDKERIQPFKGVVIKKTPKSGKGINASLTVRKISEGVGVERTFPLNSPMIEKLKVESSADIRRSRLFYLRSLTGKKARLKEIERFAEMVIPDTEPEVEPVQEVSESVQTEKKKGAAPAVETKPAAEAKAPAETPKPAAEAKSEKAEKTEKTEKK